MSKAKKYVPMGKPAWAEQPAPQPLSIQLDAILAQIEGHNLDILTPQEIISISPPLKEARTALLAIITNLLEEVIGEDEPKPRNGEVDWYPGFEFRNQLRATQRQSLNSKLGVSDE